MVYIGDVACSYINAHYNISDNNKATDIVVPVPIDIYNNNIYIFVNRIERDSMALTSLLIRTIFVASYHMVWYIDAAKREAHPTLTSHASKTKYSYC